MNSAMCSGPLRRALSREFCALSHAFCPCRGTKCGPGHTYWTWHTTHDRAHSIRPVATIYLRCVTVHAPAMGPDPVAESWPIAEPHHHLEMSAGGVSARPGLQPTGRVHLLR